MNERLLEVVYECRAQRRRELCREADGGRDGKDEIVGENYVEVSQPIKPTKIPEKIEIGYACRIASN